MINPSLILINLERHARKSRIEEAARRETKEKTVFYRRQWHTLNGHASFRGIRSTKSHDLKMLYGSLPLPFFTQTYLYSIDILTLIMSCCISTSHKSSHAELAYMRGARSCQTTKRFPFGRSRQRPTRGKHSCQRPSLLSALPMDLTRRLTMAKSPRIVPGADCKGFVAPSSAASVSFTSQWLLCA